MAEYSNATIIYVSETNFDNNVYDSDIPINGCTTDTRDRNRDGGGVAIGVILSHKPLN